MRLLNLRLYDGESFETSKLLADSAPALGPGERGDLSTYATFAVPGRQWTLRVDSESAHLLPSSRAAATLAIGVLFDLLLFLLVGGQVRLKQKARLLAQKTTAELERSRDELAASLAEKDVLLAEVHHRVKNNLQVISSLIQMQARRVGDKAVAAALTECRGRVNAIALIHEKLYEEKDVGKLGFGSYVRSLVDGIVRATHAPTQLVRLDVSVPDLHVAVERAIPCGLLLNELVTNALEHAFPDGRPGTLRVELREEAGGRVVLGVSDDGIGLPADLEPAQSPSLGLRLVSALTSQLKAKLNVERRAGGGTKFELVLASA
jgi:two-component sensor histidine kinase